MQSKWTTLEASLIQSSPKAEALQSPVTAEIAMIGRSNVGKSSLINRLVQRKALARVSSTPGRTQHAVMFGVKLRGSNSRMLELALVDLPGFGYAKVSKAKMREMGSLIYDYIAKRANLKILCLLNDCRRMPEEEEFMIRDMALEAGRSLMVIATKCDKLKRAQLAKSMDELAAAYGLEGADIVPSGEGISTAEVWDRVSLLI